MFGKNRKARTKRSPDEIKDEFDRIKRSQSNEFVCVEMLAFIVEDLNRN